MKIKFENEQIKEAINLASVVNSDNAVVRFRIGAMVDKNGAKMGSSLTVIGGTQQFCALVFHGAGKDIKESVGKEYAFKGKEFFSIIQGLINLNGEIYMEINESACFLGIEGVVRLPIGILDVAAVPSVVTVDPAKAILKAKVKVDALLSAVKVGGQYVDSKPDDLHGRNNAVFTFTYEEGKAEDKELKGNLHIYSTDGRGIARGRATVAVINDANTLKKADEYCKEKELDALTVAVPKKSLNDLFKITAEYETVLICLTETHFHVMIGGNTAYSFALAATICKAVFMMDAWAKNDWRDKTGNGADIKQDAVITIDADAFRERLGILNTLGDLSGKNQPVIFHVSKDKTVTLQLACSGENGEAKLECVEQDIPGDFSVALSGKLVSSLVSTLKRGNLRLSFISKFTTKYPVEITNGSIESKSEDSIGYLFPVRTAVQEKPVAKEEEDESDTMETQETSESETTKIESGSEQEETKEEANAETPETVAEEGEMAS